MKNTQYKLLPPSYLNFLLVLGILLHFLFPVTILIDYPYTYLGIIIFLLGIMINIWSVRVLKRDSTLDFFEAPVNLIVAGPFRFTRNPIYLSGVVISLGITIFLGSLIVFTIPLLLFVVLNKFYIPFEERKLEKAFGEEYLQYKSEVRRWI